MCVAFDAFAITSFVFIACAKSSVVTSHRKVKQVESSYFTIWSSRVKSMVSLESTRVRVNDSTLYNTGEKCFQLNTGYSNEPPLYV